MPVVVSFVSQKGGVGKSTLARALAVVAAHAGLKVRVADMDLRQATILNWDRTRTRKNETPKLEVISCSTIFEAIDASNDIELLVIDTPSGTDITTLEIASHSNLIVQPSGPSEDDLHPAILLFHELTQADIPNSRLVIALCRTLTDTEAAAAAAYIEAAGYTVLPGAIPERAAYRETHNRGQALTETRHESLNKLADDLIEALLMRVIQGLKSRDKKIRSEKKGDRVA